MYYTARQQLESLTPTPPPMRRARTRNSYSPVTIVCFSVVVMHCTEQHHQCSAAQNSTATRQSISGYPSFEKWLPIYFSKGVVTF